MTFNCKGKTTKQIIDELNVAMNDKSSYVAEDEHELITWNGNKKYKTIKDHLFEMNMLLKEEQV